MLKVFFMFFPPKYVFRESVSQKRTHALELQIFPYIVALTIFKRKC